MQLPSFSNIDYSQMMSELQQILNENMTALNNLLETAQPYTWASLIAPLEEQDDRLEKFWSRISHLNNVKNCDALRDVYNQCLPLLTEYSTTLSHHRGLFDAYTAIRQDAAFSELTLAQKKSIDNALRDFRLAGVDLPDADKATVASLSQDLAQLCNQFSNNVLDATRAWHCHVTDAAMLAGIPEHVQQAAKKAAQDAGKEGWCFELDMPIYYPVMCHAQDRSLREQMHRAYITRASDAGPCAGQHDNGSIMRDILTKRQQLANTLGFKHYAEYALATRMANSANEVIAFLDKLAAASRPKAQQELAELAEFASKSLQIETLEAWDMAYASEQYRQTAYDVSQETLRPYFPLAQVLETFYWLLNELFGIQVETVDHSDKPHPDSSIIRLNDSEGTCRSICYLDCYAREKKNGGAWMADLQGRRRTHAGETQTPIALVNCNFTPPTAERPCLLTFDEVETLFHEFGHALQHMLTTVDVPDVAGISGIPWDAVEFPSQFMEHWAWQPAVLERMAKHYQTGEALPTDMQEKMHRARHFQAAMAMCRQLEFAHFDMTLHQQPVSDDPQHIQNILDASRQRISVTPIANPNRFQNSFSHIFAGGYAAGYYSYKWAEVMAVDAFYHFIDHGVFNQDIAQRFLQCVLEPGGSEEPDVLFQRFAGRQPDPTTLLRHDQIIDAVTVDG